MGLFEGRVVIVTGASGGIGLAAARLFALEGANVLITGRRVRLLEEVTVGYASIQGMVADASDPLAAPRTIGRALELWGRLDVLVNNAGAGAIQPLADVSASVAIDIFGVNVIAPILLTSAALPHISATKGSIINISSTFGSKAGADLSLYASSKAAIEHLTRCWALELAPQGVRVNAVAPGPVETDFLRDRIGLSAEQMKLVKEQERNSIPLARRGVPEDIARWIIALANPAADWITGQIIGVDGGLAIA